MRKIFILLLTIISFNSNLKANPLSENISLSGFIRSDVIYDSRESARARENAIMLFPLPDKPDANGNDLNAKEDLTMFVLHTRLRSTITGPDAFGAKTTGIIEGEFFGTDDGDANGFRVRHAFINMDWGRTQLLFGQFWNPLFITDCLPNYNFSSPFIPYGRKPQLRVTRKFSDFYISATASMQSDFKSKGPGNEANPIISSTEFDKNSGTPGLNLLVGYKKESTAFGLGIDAKTIVPRTEFEGVKTDQSLTSLSATGWLKLDIQAITFKYQAIFGQNLTDHVMLGGYAVRKDDPEQFSNINMFSTWGELSWGKDVKLSLYGGYSRNLGTDQDVILDKNQIYAMGADIHTLYRVAPSVIVRSGPLRIISEIEYTAAIYGDFKNERLELENLKTFENIRVNLAAYYHF